MTRRRAIALSAVGFGLLAGGDAVTKRSAPAGPVARGRAVIIPGHIAAAPRPAAPLRPLPRLPPRAAAAHRLHDIVPAAPPNAITLTIDDGPHPEWTPKMLDLLAEHDVTATFSLIGVNVKQWPRLARRIAAAGHQLSNHTMTHPLGIASLSRRVVDREITEAFERIGDATGIAPKFFRSPGGAWSPRVFEAVARHGMLPIDWDVDPRDWARPGVRHIKHTMLAAKGGDILLCHDGGGDRSETIKALRDVLPKLKARGLTFVPL